MTGVPFLALLVSAVLAATAATVLVWPRLAGNRVRDIAGRLGLLGLVNTLVLLLAAGLLNAEFAFFSGWSDLAGAIFGGPGPKPVVLVRGGSAHAATASTFGSGSNDSPGGIGALPAGIKAGREQAFVVHGRQSGVTSEVLVELPLSYNSRADLHERYPVLETFQGWPGTPGAFIDSLGIGSVADRLVARHRLADMLVVSPQTSIPAGRDSECVNGVDGYPQLETWLTVDVPAWVVQHFRVRTTRSSWATMGLSAGGWCAAMATMLHPDRYAAAIVFGGYFAADFTGSYTPIPPDSLALDRYNLVDLAARAPPPVAMWLETSRLDPVSWPSTSAFLAATRAPLSVYSLVLAGAGHRTSVWQGELPQSLTWLGQTVPGFAPAAR